MDYARAYGEMHQNDKRFPGYSLGQYAPEIAKLVALHQPTRLLDYGSGKGYQYLAQRIHERWGGLLPHCFDIGVRQLNTKPEGQFGGVICTDMLEHIERPDVPKIMDELIAYTEAGGFIFLGIACRPSRKKLPDRRDCHVTVEPPIWWANQICAALERAGRAEEELAIRAEFEHGHPAHFPGTPTVWVSGSGFKQ